MGFFTNDLIKVMAGLGDRIVLTKFIVPVFLTGNTLQNFIMYCFLTMSDQL